MGSFWKTADAQKKKNQKYDSRKKENRELRHVQWTFEACASLSFCLENLFQVYNFIKMKAMYIQLWRHYDPILVFFLSPAPTMFQHNDNILLILQKQQKRTIKAFLGLLFQKRISCLVQLSVGRKNSKHCQTMK